MERRGTGPREKGTKEGNLEQGLSTQISWRRNDVSQEFISPEGGYMAETPSPTSKMKSNAPLVNCIGPA